MKNKLLTKSRFKVAMGCPTKLYYLDKEEYANKSIGDSFLEALAEGGFQVGELAKCYYPDGIEIMERDYEKSVSKTNELLEKENVVIFEAAFRYRDLFVRTDVLEKKGNTIRLMEVKSSTFDPNEPKDSFIGKKFIRSGWADYLYDIAFQKYVVEKSFVERKVSPFPQISAYLTLCDKSKYSSIDGLNQKFLVLRNENGRPEIKITGDVSVSALGEKMLTEQPVDDCLDLIYNSKEGTEYLGAKFEDYVNMLSKYFKEDKKIQSPIGKVCKGCEFVIDKEKKDNKDHKSGFEECWKEQAKFTKKDFEKQPVYNVWNYRGSDKMIADKKYFMEDLVKDDFGATGKVEGPKIENKERQWLQVEKYKKNDKTPFVYTEKLKEEMERWIYPFHFIDFETTSVALPFNKGIRPYEGIAFQYSHHQVSKDGTIEHKGEYLNFNKGEFPSFAFIRELKKELEKDNGSIFRYATHENTFLNIIRNQLKAKPRSEVPDKDELIEWIQTITTPSGATEDVWTPTRNMIDLKNIVQFYYYDPYTNGSNSIKDVLPAVLNTSKYLQEKYSKPIYGAENGIKSKNYKDWVWVTYNSNKEVEDPYHILPPIIDNITDKISERIFNADEISGGGAAMTAYAKMQFSEMSDKEREVLRKSLLRYCELDTFAMVLIWEHWYNIVN